MTGFIWRTHMQGCTRLAVKLDFLAGPFVKAVEATGTLEFRGIQAPVGGTKLECYLDGEG